MGITWKTYRVASGEGAWEPASYNIRGADGHEYGRWRRVLREHPHGLTVISRYKAPPGKAWKIVGKASELGEEVYILEGAYYDTQGNILAGLGTFMFNAPGARHGGISCDLTLYIHCCSGEPDEIVSIDLIDFARRNNLPLSRDKVPPSSNTSRQPRAFWDDHQRYVRDRRSPRRGPRSRRNASGPHGRASAYGI
jgi:hypothetical protein